MAYAVLLKDQAEKSTTAGTVHPEPSTAAAFNDARSIHNRLRGVDGLRAAAALWVLLFHMHAFSQSSFPQIPGLDLFLRSGSTGVSLFLVLSGFCLYLPFAGGRTGRFKVGRFFIRRCRRLLPAYYASLAFALLLELFAADWIGSPGLDLPGAAWQALTHLTLTHTLFPDAYFRLNGAYWSLGLEWQLYLGLPLLVWGVRHFGITRVLVTVTVVNLMYRIGLFALERTLTGPESGPVVALLPNQLPGRWAEFAFGMLAAELHTRGQAQIWARRLKFLPVLLVPLAVAGSNWPESHILYGMVFFVLLILVLNSSSVANKVFSWRPLVAIGTMSYSLYLVHQPIVQGLAHFLQVSGGASSNTAFLILLLTTPVILVLAWILFITVERRTMTSGPSPASPQPIALAQREAKLTPAGA